jgi:biotin carboxylase
MPRKSPAQLDREIQEVLHKPAPKAAAKSTKGKSTKTIDGYKVTIWDYKTQGGARFAAYYDLLPASVVGRGETKAAAIADLKRAADRYGKQRHDEIEREDWAQHESNKEDALSRGEY